MNFNEITPISKSDFDIGKVGKSEIENLLYKTFFEQVAPKYFVVNGTKAKVLDLFCSKAFVSEHLDRTKFDYVGLDVISNPKKNGREIKPDVVNDVNDMELADDGFEFIFAPGNKIAYGRNHHSLFEIERVVKSKGYLIVSLTKFWHNSGFNQMLFCNRQWEYLEAIQIKYSFMDIDDNRKEKLVETSKCFVVYRYKGK